MNDNEVLASQGLSDCGSLVFVEIRLCPLVNDRRLNLVGLIGLEY